MFRPVAKLNTRPTIQRFSTSPVKSNLIEVSVDRKTGYSIISLNRPPLNALNLELFKAISDTVEDLSRDNCRGAILTSTSESTFSVGLDITELHQSDNDRFQALRDSFQAAWIALYTTSFPIASAINGHAIAGGCLLTISTGYRVMCNKFKIGLNENQPSIARPMSTRSDTKSSERTLSKLFSAEQAKHIGLTDEVAESKEDAIQKCKIYLDQCSSLQHGNRKRQAFQLKAIQDFGAVKTKDSRAMHTFFKLYMTQNHFEDVI